MTATHANACGTCRHHADHGQPLEHDECHARAQLVPAPDAPGYDDLAGMTEEQRKALPPRFHTPVYDDLGTPKLWLCAVCWGDGSVSAWPCEVAANNGRLVFANPTA
jgi:hypothetical protein